MQTGEIRTLGVCAIVSVASLCATAQAGQVGPWHRATDWLPGTDGSISGAPGPGGPATWVYEYTSSGGSLFDATPWYSQPSTPMTWDSNWYESGSGVWAAGDDLSPPVDQNRMAHNVAAAATQNVPLIRFVNPIGSTTDFDVSGLLRVVWDGVGGVGRPTTVDLVIAKQNASHTSTSLLYAMTVNKPNNFASVGDFVELPVDLTGVQLGSGESIIISHRGRTPVNPGGWIHLHDALDLTVIPAPGAAAVLGLGGLAVLRRRRR